MADGIAGQDTRKRRVNWRYLGDAGKELLLVAALFMVYKLGRGMATGDEDTAFRNARELLRIQTDLHLPDEAAFQNWVMQSHAVVESANRYYLWVHFPVTVVFLLWLWIWHRDHYPWIRNVLAVMTGIALIIAIVLPMAPPRLMSSYGFVDTGMLFGESPYAGAGAKISNQYAAMPSLHFGWSVVVAMGVMAVWCNGDRKRRVASRLIWLHPAITLFVVLVTANHYWLDALVALLLLAVALLVVPFPDKGPHARLVRILPTSVFVPSQRRSAGDARRTMAAVRLPAARSARTDDQQPGSAVGAGADADVELLADGEGARPLRR